MTLDEIYNKVEDDIMGLARRVRLGQASCTGSLDILDKFKTNVLKWTKEHAGIDGGKLHSILSQDKRLAGKPVGEILKAIIQVDPIIIKEE